MRREQARLIDAAADPYDVLLDDYEKGVTAARLDEVFAEVWGGGETAWADGGCEKEDEEEEQG